MDIQVKNYSKSIGGELILDNINLNLKGGNIYGIVGRNGSGKSVLLKSICGFAKIVDGEIKIGDKCIGKDIEFSDDIGAILDGAGFLNGITGFKNLKILAQIRGKIDDKKIKEIMIMMGLDPDSKKKYKAYSLGMKQKLALCQAFMEDCKILVLDEVFNGLDAESVKLVRSLLFKYKEDGKLIIVTSHIKDDIDILCDEVYEIADKKIVCLSVKN